MLLNVLIQRAEAQNSCVSVQPTVSVGSTIASADSWGNLRGNAGSLRAETAKLLQTADKGLQTTNPPKDACPAQCRVSSQPQIHFETIPNKFLTDYSDHQKCEAHLKKTTASPLQYSGKIFPSIEELNEYYGEFSQGKGPDGKNLYERCDGDCSPQYYSTIEHVDGKYRLNAKVICGHARDKSENNYKLKAVYTWSCAEQNL